MLAINNKIFDSAAAANGLWRNISNLGAYSLHFRGLEGNVWVEVSNDPNVLTNGTVISAPVQPTGSAVPADPSDGNAGTWLFKVTYVTPGGETTASVASASVVVSNNSKTLQVNSPIQDAGGFAVGWNVYVNNGDGVYRLQNETAMAIGQPFILIDFYPAGEGTPSTNTSGQPNAGLNVSGNLTVATTGASGETQIIADGAGNLVFNPSCINFNFIRVRKTGGGSTETFAYLLGQNI